MLYTKIQPKSFLGSGEHGKCSHLVQLCGTIRTNWQYPFDRRSHVKFVCVEVLRPSQSNRVMSSAVSLPNHTFTGQA